MKIEPFKISFANQRILEIKKKVEIARVWFLSGFCLVFVWFSSGFLVNRRLTEIYRVCGAHLLLGYPQSMCRGEHLHWFSLE